MIYRIAAIPMSLGDFQRHSHLCVPL